MMKNLQRWILLFALALSALPCRNAARLSLDPSGIQEFDNQMKLYTYNILSHLDHLATSKFKLRLSPKAAKETNFLQNITRTGISYAGLTGTPDFNSRSEAAFKGLESTLPDESLFLLRALSRKNLKIPLALTPTDESLPEAISFMDAFKQFWLHVDRVAALEVEEFNPLKIPKFLEETIANRSKNVEESLKRRGRKFLVPEMPLQVSQDHLRSLLNDVFINPRYHDESVLEKVVIRAFITRTFENFGLLVYNHEFSAHETHYLFGKQILGTNIVGILPGEKWGTPEDTPMIVGAHYDTVANTTGTIDNASGTSAVIEVARMLTSSKCKFKNSIVFVAFDLEEIGTQGSFMFVKDFLLKLLFPSFGMKSIGGAIILDCVGNWDINGGTQEVPNAWEEKVHGLKQRIQDTNNTGDFLAVMYRETPDHILAERLQHYYRGLGDPMYRLELMSLKELHESRPNDTINLENFDFFRSDHYRFWYPSREAPNVSFPALLLTDTGPYRGKMSQCYHAACDTMENIQPSIGFLAKIAQAAAWVVADLALGSCGPNGLFKIPELFHVATQRDQIEHGVKEEDIRPAVTIDGVMEILKFLGKINLQDLDSSSDALKNTKSNISVLFKAPMHRFSILSAPKREVASRLNRINPLSKLTITIHGSNSTFLIPLRVSVPSTAASNNSTISQTEHLSTNAQASKLESSDGNIIPSEENIHTVANKTV